MVIQLVELLRVLAKFLNNKATILTWVACTIKTYCISQFVYGFKSTLRTRMTFRVSAQKEPLPTSSLLMLCCTWWWSTSLAKLMYVYMIYKYYVCIYCIYILCMYILFQIVLKHYLKQLSVLPTLAFACSSRMIHKIFRGCQSVTD